jgi:hypothetical protein
MELMTIRKKMGGFPQTSRPTQTRRDRIVRTLSGKATDGIRNGRSLPVHNEAGHVTKVFKRADIGSMSEVFLHGQAACGTKYKSCH